MLVRWLAASWYFDEAEVALYTMGISHHKNLEANRDRRDSAGRRGRMRGRLRVHVYRSHMPTLPSATTSAQVSETDFIDEEDSIFSEEGKLTGADTVARAYISAGLVDQAIPLFVQNLTDREHLLGPDHPDTLTARNNLASAYRDAGRLKQAINLHEQTSTDFERVLGPDHTHTLTSRNNLARAYQDAGRLEQAIDLFEQTLTDSERILGPNHPWTTLFRDNLARAREARN